MLEQLLEEAGFAVGRLDRCELPIECSDVNQDHPAVPAKLLENLSQDADARTTHFVALAYPLPHSHLDLMQKRMREMAEQNDAARRDRDLLKNERSRREATLQELTEASTKVGALLKANRHLREDVALLEEQQQEPARALEVQRQESSEAMEAREKRNQALSKALDAILTSSGCSPFCGSRLAPSR